jgi:hypothetical protein
VQNAGWNECAKSVKVPRSIAPWAASNGESSGRYVKHIISPAGTAAVRGRAGPKVSGRNSIESVRNSFGFGMRNCVGFCAWEIPIGETMSDCRNDTFSDLQNSSGFGPAPGAMIQGNSSRTSILSLDGNYFDRGPF